MPGTNPYEEVQRERKASRLAVTLFAADYTADQVAEFKDVRKRAVELVAEVKPSSETTWALATTKLASMHSAAMRRAISAMGSSR